MIIQVRSADLEQVLDVLEEYNLGDSKTVAEPVVNREIVICHGDIEVFRAQLELLQGWWSELTFRMQTLRDNPECAREAYEDVLADNNPGLSVHLGFQQRGSVAHLDHKPKVAILREQGVNSHREMAAAFHRAGFEPYDVHMSDLFSGKVSLDQYRGLVACGGFSYGDVLGAGEGWAKSILYNESIRHLFGEFFARDNIFALGVCNGCQMLAALKKLIPGADHWPRFVRNRSDQFEARFSMQYCIALALRTGTISLCDFTPSAVQRPEMRELFERIDMQSHDLEKESDSESDLVPSIVTITLKDGRSFEARQDTPRGDAANPLNEDERYAKFTDCCSGFLSDGDFYALKAAIEKMERLDSIRDCTRLLRFEAGADKGERFDLRA